MPPRNKTETLVLNEHARMKITVETAKAIKIDSILAETVSEDWLPKSQLPFLEVVDENGQISAFTPELLCNQTILDLENKEVSIITIKDWILQQKNSILSIVQYFDSILTTFKKNMINATQFWEGGRFAYCQVCGRTLTHETSVEHGIGPICAEYINQKFEREQIQIIMNSYRMVYEGQFDRLDPELKVWVSYKFRKKGRKTNSHIKIDTTTVGELSEMYEHQQRGKVIQLKWELKDDYNRTEPTWITARRTGIENREVTA